MLLWEVMKSFFTFSFHPTNAQTNLNQAQLYYCSFCSEQMIRIASIGFETKSKTCSKHLIHCYDYHPYSKSSLTLKLYERRFNLNFPWVSLAFMNSWNVSSHILRYNTNPLAIQLPQWQSREARIEPPLSEYEWSSLQNTSVCDNANTVNAVLYLLP